MSEKFKCYLYYPIIVLSYIIPRKPKAYTFKIHTYDLLFCLPFLPNSTDEALTSYVEFTVQKVSPRHEDSVRRSLCLTDSCLVERDPATYNVCTVKPLCDVSMLTDI